MLVSSKTQRNRGSRRHLRLKVKAAYSYLPSDSSSTSTARPSKTGVCLEKWVAVLNFDRVMWREVNTITPVNKTMLLYCSHGVEQWKNTILRILLCNQRITFIPTALSPWVFPLLSLLIYPVNYTTSRIGEQQKSTWSERGSRKDE